MDLAASTKEMLSGACRMPDSFLQVAGCTCSSHTRGTPRGVTWRDNRFYAVLPVHHVFALPVSAKPCPRLTGQLSAKSGLSVNTIDDNTFLLRCVDCLYSFYYLKKQHVQKNALKYRKILYYLLFLEQQSLI